MTQYKNYLKELSACTEAVKWSAQFPGAQAAWEACERADWMLWLLAKRLGPVGGKKHRRLVKLACKCARTALEYVSKGEQRPLKAIQTAEQWVDGKATIEEVRAAAYAAGAAGAAGAAAVAAADVADAADAADAAGAAGAAADAAAAYAAYAADAAGAAGAAAVAAADVADKATGQEALIFLRAAAYVAAYAAYAADAAGAAARPQALARMAKMVRKEVPDIRKWKGQPCNS